MPDDQGLEAELAHRIAVISTEHAEDPTRGDLPHVDQLALWILLGASCVGAVVLAAI
jgi:hypothetical protein